MPGLKGDRGFPGNDGPKGYQGLKGAPGLRGLPGPQGFSGEFCLKKIINFCNTDIFNRTKGRTRRERRQGRSRIRRLAWSCRPAWTSWFER